MCLFVLRIIIGWFINFSQSYTLLSLNLHYKLGPASNLAQFLRGRTVFREQIVPKGGAWGFAKCRFEQGGDLRMVGLYAPQARAAGALGAVGLFLAFIGAWLTMGSSFISPMATQTAWPWESRKICPWMGFVRGGCTQDRRLSAIGYHAPDSRRADPPSPTAS